MERSLEDRLAAQEIRLLGLERQLRNWKRGAALVALALAALVSLGQATPEATVADVLSTHKLRIVDSQGRARANLMADGTDCYLLLGDSNGKPRVGIRCQDGQDASLYFAGDDGQPVASITVTPSGMLVKRNF